MPISLEEYRRNVRGLLCNRKLGLIESDDSWFTAALLYLGKYVPMG